MFFLIKFCIYFTISFFILSVPLSNKTIFGHLHSLSNPYTSKVFNVVSHTSKEVAKDTTTWTKKLFTNSKPRFDNVSTKQASTVKEEILHQSYTAEEKELLLKILKD